MILRLTAIKASPAYLVFEDEKVDEEVKSVRRKIYQA